MITPNPTSPSPGDGWWWSPIEACWKPRDAIDKIKRLRSETGCDLAMAYRAIQAAEYDYDKALADVKAQQAAAVEARRGMDEAEEVRRREATKPCRACGSSYDHDQWDGCPSCPPRGSA